MGDRHHAQALYSQGLEAINAKQYPEHLTHAYKLFASACYADTNWYAAFYQMGNVVSDLNGPHAAIACFRRALESGEATGTDLAKIYTNIAWKLEETQQIDEALAYGLKAIELDPTLLHAHINLSIIYKALDDAKKSLAHAEQALLLDQSPATHCAVAFACLFDRQWMRGLKHFEHRFEWRLHHFRNYPYPQWTGEPGRVVFLVADQGLGDTLSYARFVRETCKRSKYVHACVQHELLRLFQNAFIDIPNLNLLPGLNSNFPAADAWITFVSLPHALGLTDDEFVNTPQIVPPVYSLPKTWKVQDRKLHVGIAWRGSPLNDIDKHRNLPPHLFFELARVPGLQLYSLQVGEASQDIAKMGGGALVQDLTPYIHDIVDTVSLVRELDLVITVESALGHICALADVECWIPYSAYGKDYRLGLTGENPIWTPKTRVFRQGKDARWEPVFDKMVQALNERSSNAFAKPQMKQSASAGT